MDIANITKSITNDNYETRDAEYFCRRNYTEIGLENNLKWSLNILIVFETIKHS